MYDLIATSNKTWHKAVQLLVTLLIVLFLGKVISLLPVMQKLVMFHTIKASNAVWFLAEISALCLFYFFARYTVESIPNKGGVLHFLRGIANPFTILIMVILTQDLVWQVLAPFVRHSGKTIYFSIAISIIVGVSVWLAFTVYKCANTVAASLGQLRYAVSKLIQPSKSICDHCKAELSSKAHFCDQCGHKMPESRLCPECGVNVSKDQKFCRECGADLVNVAGNDSATKI